MVEENLYLEIVVVMLMYLDSNVLFPLQKWDRLICSTCHADLAKISKMTRSSGLRFVLMSNFDSLRLI